MVLRVGVVCWRGAQLLARSETKAIAAPQLWCPAATIQTELSHLASVV